MNEPTIKLTVNGKRAEMSLSDARDMYAQLRQLFEPKRDALKEFERAIRAAPFVPTPSPQWLLPPYGPWRASPYVPCDNPGTPWWQPSYFTTTCVASSASPLSCSSESHNMTVGQ